MTFSSSARSRPPSAPPGQNVFPPFSPNPEYSSVSSFPRTSLLPPAAHRGHSHQPYISSCSSGRARRYRITRVVLWSPQIDRLGRERW